MAADNTRLGRPGDQHCLILSAKAHDYPGMIKLETYNSGGTLVERWIWIDGSGTPRIGTAEPTDQDSDGSVFTIV